MSPRALRMSKVAAAAGVVVLLLLAWRYGVFAAFSDPKGLAARLVALGAWGYLAFIVAYALLQPFGLPGTVFIVAAPLIWPWPVAFALSLAGTKAASVVGFSFARFIAREAVVKNIPARFLEYDEALARRAFVTVFTLRLIFWMPPLLHAFFGVSKVRFGTHFWGSLVGYLIPLFLVSFFGQRLFDLARATPLWVWGALAGALVMVATTVLVLRRRRV
jgi:uncharacterized membrane protein YdjX (TVP38/TMEM64 family)